MSEKYKNAQVSTVFLGGGTPTLVPPDVMGPVLKALRDLTRAWALMQAQMRAQAQPMTAP